MTAGSGRARWGLYAVGTGVLAAIAVIAISNVNFLLATSEQSRAASVRSLENLALSIERSVAAEISERQDDLAGIVQWLETARPGMAPPPPGIDRVLGEFSEFDGQGRPVGPAAARLPARSYAQEPFFRILQDNPDATSIVTAGTPTGVPGAALVLSRRLQTASGTFDGVVANTVSTTRLSHILGRFDLGDGGTVAILNKDGRLLASDRPETRRGLDLSRSEAFLHVIEHGLGSFDATSLVDGRRRAYAARSIEGTGLLLFVGTSLGTVYAPFRAVAEVEVAAALLLAASIAGFAIAVRRELRLRRASKNAAELAAQAAQRSEALVNTYFDNLAHGVLGIRVQPGNRFEIERANVNAQRLLGLSTDFLGQDPCVVFGHDILPGLVPQLRQCLQTRRPAQWTTPFRSAARNQSLRLTVTPVAGEPDGAVDLLLVSLEDVTFQEVAQAQLLHSHRMSGIERVTSGVANEFNNLLQSMIGHLEMLAEEAHGHSVAAHARSALDAAARGTRLTQGLLSSSSQQLLQPEAVPADRMMSDLSRVFEAKRDPRVRLVTVVEPGTPPAFADLGHLQSALLNICENGQEAMLPGGGTLTVAVRAKAGLSSGGTRMTDRFVAFRVSDSGAGMAAEVLARAREPFFTTKGDRFRSGLGLSMADGFARQSGGELSLESAPGKGTAVELSLPAAEPDVADDGWAPLSRPMRVLVVDDSADQLAMLEDLLRDDGYHVTAMGDAREAASTLRSGERFDILVTDYVMPGASGMDLIEEAFTQQPGIQALLITGTPNAPTQSAARGSLILLRKPYRADQLLRRVRQMARAVEHASLPG